jgi:hypothetical protein
MTTPNERPATISSLVAPRRRSTGNVALVLALVVAAGGIAFAAGRATAPAAAAGPGIGGAPGQGPGASFAPNASGAPGGLPGGSSMSLEGTVSSVSGTSLTLTTASGRVVSVDVSGASYHAQAAASAADVVDGASVRLQVTGMGGLGSPGGLGGAAASPAASAAASTVTATEVTILAP